MNDMVLGIILVLIGLLALIGAALNWSIVSRSSKLLNLLLGDTIARIIYGVVGFLLILLGVARMAGINLLGR